MDQPIDIDLARALRRLYDCGGQRRPVDAKLSVSNMRRLVQLGWAEAVEAPKLSLTVAGLEAMPAALALLAAAPGPSR